MVLSPDLNTLMMYVRLSTGIRLSFVISCHKRPPFCTIPLLCIVQYHSHLFQIEQQIIVLMHAWTSNEFQSKILQSIPMTPVPVQKEHFSLLVVIYSIGVFTTFPRSKLLGRRKRNSSGYPHVLGVKQSN